MIPQNFKDILGNSANGGLLQTIAMIIFIIFFVALVIMVIRKPKKYYQEEENAPLTDDIDNNQIFKKL